MRPLRRARTYPDLPAINAHTIKGKGFSFAENQAAFHNGPMTQAQYELGLEEADAALAQLQLLQTEV